MGQLRQHRLVLPGCTMVLHSEVNENSLIYHTSFGKVILVLLKYVFLLLPFLEQYSCVVDSSLFYPTSQNSASAKGSSSMLEKALPSLPCLHSAVKKNKRV